MINRVLTESKDIQKKDIENWEMQKMSEDYLANHLVTLYSLSCLCSENSVSFFIISKQIVNNVPLEGLSSHSISVWSGQS